MTNEIATRDEMKAVERWENEGGRVPPVNNLWTSLKRLTTEHISLDGQAIDARKSAPHQHAVFSRFNVGRAV